MRYATICADPPWPMPEYPGWLAEWESYGESHDDTACRPLPYEVMPVGEIANLRVRDIALPDSVLYLWTTSRFLEEAFAVVRAWGFTYSRTLVWSKTPRGRGLGGPPYGISAEFVLYAKRGSPAPAGHISTSWFRWERDKLRHSAKPDAFYRMAATLSPGPRVDLFARTRRRGWDAWGYEAPGAVLLPELTRERAYEDEDEAV